MYLLDTDILVDILRGHQPAIEWLKKTTEVISIHGFVAMELVQGCRNRKEQDSITREIEKYTLIWPDEVILKNAYEIYKGYYLSNSVGIIDAIIGQTAVDRDMPLCTFNEKHYKIIENIELVKPYKK